MDQMIPVTHVRNDVQWSGSAALITPEPWMQDALCAQTDPETFFPEKGGKGADDARKICGACEVRDECLAFALRTRQEEGVWGGKSPRQRRRMLALPENDQSQRTGLDGLTVEQRRVAVRDGLARGWTDKQIALQIGCTLRTVERVRTDLTPRGAA